MTVTGIKNHFSHMEEDIALFKVVKEGLDKKGTLGYESSVASLSSALQNISSEASQTFLNQCFLRMVSILLDQNPSKIGAFERGKIEDSLDLSVRIILEILPVNPGYLDVLVKVFNRNATYYAGSKTCWTNFPGDPHTRVSCIAKFYNSNGFRVVHSILTQSWQGADVLYVLLSALKDVDTRLTSDISSIIISDVMQQLMDLPEEQVKKESSESLSGLLRCLMPRQGDDKVEEFYAFWLKYVLKMMECRSIVLKLFAWEQVHDIIREAISTRPPPNRYLVRNAGVDEVNGIYTSTFKLGEVPSYVKQAERPGDNTFTLFRCTMKSKQKWWFISIADLEKPGTDKDIDYYQHKSTPDQENEPPVFGWSTVAGAHCRGIDPPPCLTRLEPLPVHDTNGRAATSLVDSLLTWALENKLLDKVFGQSIHREIVSRSKHLVTLLAEENRLEEEAVRMIWKVGMQSHAEEIHDEVFSLLASAALHMQDKSLDVLMDLAEEGMRAGGQESLGKVAEFVYKMHGDGAKYFRSLSEHAKSRVTSLSWSLYNDPIIEGSKSQLNVEELLSVCLRHFGKSGQVFVYLSECSDLLRSCRGAVVDEKRVARVITTLEFLLSNHADPGLDEVLAESGFHAVLLGELERFMRNHCTGVQAEAITENICSQVSKRLNLIRSAFGMSHRIKMTHSELDKMWGLFTLPELRELMFHFLRKAGIKQGSLDSAFSISECLHVFRTMLCSGDIDWTSCGEEAYDCFSVYFTGLGRKSDLDDTVRVLGVETLWKITLNIPSESSATEAIALLLQAYQEMSRYTPEVESQLLSRVFSELQSATQQCRSVGALSSSLQMQVARCTDILSEVISKSQQQVVHAQNVTEYVPHAVRGRVFRIKIVVRYREITHNVQYTTLYNKRPVVSEKTAVIDLHPLHSLLVLKNKIASLTGTRQQRKVNVEFDSSNLVGDSLPISHFGIVDGSEVSAVVMHSSSAMAAYGDDDFSDIYYTNKSSRHGGPIDYQHRLDGITSMENFNCIISLIETLEAHEFFELSKALWSTLMVIPTQPDVLAEIERKFGIEECGAWASMFHSGSNVRSAYTLQIVDSILQPAPELITCTADDVANIREVFITNGGFASVLDFFVSGGGTDRIGKLSLAMALHIIHHCLFDPMTGVALPELIADIQQSSSVVLEKLLTVAHNAADADESGIVQDALGTITPLLQSPSVASQLTSNPHAKGLLTSVLRSGSKTVREMAADFAVQVGKSQPVVLSWLLAELDTMSPGDRYCYDIFRTFCLLVQQTGKMKGRVDIEAIAASVSRKLLEFEYTDVYVDDDRSMLLGCLELLKCLVDIDATAVRRTELGSFLIEKLMDDFLFSMPVNGKDRAPVCCTPETRRAAFAVLNSFVAMSVEPFVEVLDRLQGLYSSAAQQMKHSWGLQVSHDVKRPNIQFSGLKNQGCTCYLNSLIQQLFMNKSFRDAVMRAPLRDIYRSTLWHLDDAMICGSDFLFEWAAGVWRRGKVLSYDSQLRMHTVRYASLDGTPEHTATFNIHSGRYQKETGRVKQIPSDGEEPLSERDAAAIAVLEQLQRTFCFMEKSKKRYFDPKPFIEACKTLNLNFNVYHQNDASEFCDQLLDRLETAMKGKFTRYDVWNDMKTQVFGGKMLYQKIPKDCDIYDTDKRDCGHWQSTRKETFLKTELIIRGKDKIEDSLSQLVEGELMDGDNKIMCDVCNNKKDTVRRTCFGTLPNVLILHLKRFDLDFTTFETVKLNNRIAFPMRINMFRYTKEGIEAEELAREQEGAELVREAGKDGKLEVKGGDTDIPMDISDYEYELHGVLVHSGIAQGGHYYSFIRDTHNPDQWYLFDDDDVSPFNPENIPTQCYGGTYSTTIQGMSSTIEEDRSSNALMLFYNKVKHSESVDDDDADVPDHPAGQSLNVSQADSAIDSSSGYTYVDGYEAFDREVGESNLRHTLSNYLVDAGLHGFVRSLIVSVYSSRSGGQKSVSLSDTSSQDPKPVAPLTWTADTDIICNTIRFGCRFLLDVVLHCRERSGVCYWLTVLKNAFNVVPEMAAWFIKYVLGNNYGVMKEYLFRCGDTVARSTFVQLLSLAIGCLCPKDMSENYLDLYLNYSTQELIALTREQQLATKPILVLLTKSVLKLLPDVLSYLHTCDELFALIREIALFPPLRKFLVDKDTIAHLCIFVIPEKVPQAVRALYATEGAARINAADCRPFHSIIFEVLAALLGVPQTQKVNLLNEKSNIWEPELTQAARDALTIIFEEVSHAGGMDSRDILAYMDRVHGCDGSTPKLTTLQVRSILDRYDTTADGRLSLSGFLRYYADTAHYQPKSVWKDLKAFNFLNDLSRSAGPLADSGLAVQMSQNAHSKLSLPKNSRICLLNISIFEVGLEAAEVATVAIAQRFCTFDIDASSILIRVALRRLHHILKDWAWNPAEAAIIGFLRVLINIEDGLLDCRLEEMYLGDQGLLKVVLNERFVFSFHNLSDSTYSQSYDQRNYRRLFT